jgi:hypothetical protein
MTENQVLKVVTVSTPLSATAIAKKLGKAKANAEIKNLIQALVTSGKVAENTELFRYSVYSKVGKGGAVKAATKAPAKSKAKKSKDSVVESVNLDAPASDIPGTPQNMLSNYTIKSIKNKKKESKVKVTLPSKKSIVMDDDANLIIINGEPTYVVKTPQDVVSCLRKYALNKGMKHFTVDDITQNKKIGTEGDVQINDNHLMFFTIKKHNKAA